MTLEEIDQCHSAFMSHVKLCFENMIFNLKHYLNYNKLKFNVKLGASNDESKPHEKKKFSNSRLFRLKIKRNKNEILRKKDKRRE